MGSWCPKEVTSSSSVNVASWLSNNKKGSLEGSWGEEVPFAGDIIATWHRPPESRAPLPGDADSPLPQTAPACQHSGAKRTPWWMSNGTAKFWLSLHPQGPWMLEPAESGKPVLQQQEQEEHGEVWFLDYDSQKHPSARSQGDPRNCSPQREISELQEE